MAKKKPTKRKSAAKDAQMDGYLVVLAMLLDEVPLRLFKTLRAATRYAKRATWDIPKEHPALASSDPHSICVMHFRRGRPTKIESIRFYEEEQ